MHILLTGASGLLGSHTLVYLLKRGHTVLATDRTPLHAETVRQIESLPQTQRHGLTFKTTNLTDYKSLEEILPSTKLDGVINLGAIPDPLGKEARDVHNNNVVASYNLLYTLAARGVDRIVMASSVNAMGLSYSPDGHHRFLEMPVTEQHPIRPEDPYALSKAIGEMQASALVRLFPNLRIASLRFHMVKFTYTHAVQHVRWEDAFAWTSYDAAASACLKGLTSGHWEGHEVFNIAAPQICWEGGLSVQEQVRTEQKDKRGTVELLNAFWKGRVDFTGPSDWWALDPRRSTWDSTKAERLLDWDHDTAGEADL